MCSGATKQRFKKSIFPGECPEDKQLQSMADREECPEDKQLQSMADREEETASKGTLEEKPPEEENIFVLDNNASEEITNENTDLKQGRKAGSIISQVNEVFGAVKRRFKKSKISGECPGDKQFQSMADREDLRILLVGHTGHGKSSTGNSLLAREEFENGLLHESITKTCHRG
ncbi:hypothetical protein DPMN_017647, partial [Dreissena polymorpha]